MPSTHRLLPGANVRLADITTRGKDLHADRKAAEKQFNELRKEMAEQQNRLYAEHKQKLLIVFQAIDAGGKDGTIRRVLRGVNPQGVRVKSFKKPTAQELAHDYLRALHQAVPAAGMIGVFNRSHYEDVLAVRVHNLVTESTWRPRYEQINQFEKLLCDTGTVILKFLLHISPEEQKQRFQDRIDRPEKHWKFSPDDLEKRKDWHKYQEAFEDMINLCTTSHAPWYVIPADQKWYRNLAIAKVIVDALRHMDPQYPTPAVDPHMFTVE